MPIKSKTGVCSSCGETRVYGNVSKKLCVFCNSKRLKEGKPVKEHKPKKSSLARSKPIAKKRTKTGELDMFREIWQERTHECEWCGRLITEPSPSNFAHIKAKSTHPELRLCKDNIKILCFECHDAMDCRGVEVFNKRKDLYREC